MNGALRIRLAGLLLLCAPAASAASATPPAPMTNEEIDALAFKTYLYSRLGDKENALDCGGRVLEQRPEHAGVLLALCSLWEADHDAERLVEAANRALAEMPENDQALFYKASADFMLRRYADARIELLENRRLNFPPGRPYPYQSALAAAAAQSGDWRSALYAHERIVHEGGAYETLANNRRVYDDLLRRHEGEATADLSIANAPSRYAMTTLRAGVAEQTSVRARVSASVASRETALNNADGFAGAGIDRQSGRLGLDYFIGTQWTLAAALGADTDGHPDASFALTHTPTRGRKIGIACDYAIPADDDADYAIANIRQTRILATYEDQFTERTGTNISAGPRSLHPVDDAPQDWGWVASGEIYHHARNRIPRFTPYFQSLWASNPLNPAVGSALSALRDDGTTTDINGTFDLQRAGLRTEIPLKRTVLLATDVYTGTSLLDGGFLYGVMSEFRWRPVKTLTFQTYAGWDKGTVFNTYPYGVIRAGISAIWHF